MQEHPLWPVTLCGGAARRAVLAIGAAGEENPLPLAGGAPVKNPLPLAGEGRVRVREHRRIRTLGAIIAPSPHPDPLPQAGEGEEGSASEPGTVIAVFARSFYLANAAGGLACVDPAGLGGGPLNMLCALPATLDWRVSGLRTGDTASWDGVRLLVAGRFQFSLADAVAWRPTPPPASWDVATLAAGLAVLAKLAAARAATAGFAPLVAALASPRLESPGLSAASSPLLQLAWPCIASLADWSASGGDAAPPAAAEILIGLGLGLTPSGDDLIGGAMIALRALGRVGMASRLAAWALPLARERTGAISAAHLACAAAGEGSFALHDLIAGLVTPGAPGLADSVATLAAIGHSSGWDALAGVALAAAAVASAA